MRTSLFCCLPLCVVMGMLVNKTEGCLRESMIDLGNLQRVVGNGGDIKLYCPPVTASENCVKETLDCFTKELFVLNYEYDGIQKEHVADLIDKLNDTFINFLSDLNTSRDCQHCEIYKEEPVDAFLTKLMTFLQHIHYKCSSIPQ